MKALLKKIGLDLVLKNVPMPIPKKNEVLVKVDISGICRTDIYVARGLINHSENLIIGHEFSGWVEQSNSSKFRKGDYIACNPIFYDGSMFGIEHNGSFSEYITVNENYLYNANGVKPKLAAYVEPIAASLAPLKSKTISKNGKGALIGNNRISQLTKEIMIDAGYQCEIIELNNLKNLKPNSFDYIIETFTNSEVFEVIPSILKKEGTLILKSRNPEKIPINLYEFVKKEIIIESLYYNDFNLAVDYAKNKSYLFEKLLGNVYSIEDWEKAFEENEKGVHKIFIKP